MPVGVDTKLVLEIAGTAQLGGFQNITITGGVPSPAGQGGTANVQLYIP